MLSNKVNKKKYKTYQIPLKEIKEDLNNWENIPCSLLKNLILLKWQ